MWRRNNTNELFPLERDSSKGEMNRIDKAKQQVTVPYGYELILDLHGCNPAIFTRDHLDRYFTELCDLIDMEKCQVHFWDDVDVPSEERQTSPLTKGTSAVCFILTSTIVVHTLDDLGAVYVNIFSCKEFDPGVAAKFTEEWFEADSCKPTFIKRM